LQHDVFTPTTSPQEISVPKSSSFALTLIASLFVVSSAHATVDLIAKGQLSGTTGDLSRETAAPLENGAPGNLFGGIGSAMTYAGCTNFIAVPDRGPNAIPFNPAIDDTASYINRFQTLNLQLSRAPSGADLPYVLTPKLTATTLLHTSDQLVYGNGAAAGVPNGAPKLNKTHHTNYFTGRSDNFDPTRRSTNPLDARLDPESVRISNDGDSVYISDEYGPYIYQFDRQTGRRHGNQRQHGGPRCEQRHGRPRDFAGRQDLVRRDAKPAAAGRRHQRAVHAHFAHRSAHRQNAAVRV
jgi:hypothetical protein